MSLQESCGKGKWSCLRSFGGSGSAWEELSHCCSLTTMWLRILKRVSGDTMGLLPLPPTAPCPGPAGARPVSPRAWTPQPCWQKKGLPARAPSLFIHNTTGHLTARSLLNPTDETDSHPPLFIECTLGPALSIELALVSQLRVSAHCSATLQGPGASEWSCTAS